VVEYVGTDVIPDVCKKTRTFANNFWKQKTTAIYCQPSEVLARSKPFLEKYRQHFDVVFFSPPYYRYELYPGDNQSTTVYSSYKEWLAGYWEPTIQLCHQVLKSGGRMCYILSDYGTTDHYNLVNDMNEITGRHFKWKRTLKMHNKNVNSTSHRETDEKIMIYMK
jgi:tRNA1(Val) A37 N6-methylase TrmN6